ncbi:hypothetical protein Tco_0291969 [Tanacetum coccineum]
MSKRVESFRDKDSLGKDASKQGRRINAIDANEDITLVNVQDDAEMFDVNTLTRDEDKGKGIMVEEPMKTMKKKDLIRLDEETAKRLQAEFDEEERLAREKDEANVALIEEWDDIQAKIEADHELAQRLYVEEQAELSIKEKEKLFQQLLEQRRKHFAAKSAEDKWNKPPTQAQHRKIMCTYLKNMEEKNPKDLKNKYFNSIQKMFDRAFKRVNTFVVFRIDLVEAELQSLMKVIPDEEEVVIYVVPFATKPPTIVDWKIHKEGKKIYYQIVRADGKSQMYRVFSLMLKSFSREDLEDLYKLVKAKYKSTRSVEDLDLVLWSDLNTMFEPHGRIVEIKILLNAVSITAALIDVNAAQSKLVLLENFNENYSKCSRLLYKSCYCWCKINAAKGVNAASEEVSIVELVSTAYVISKEFDLLKWDQHKIMGESAKRHEENSNLIKEIRASTDAPIRNQGASIKTLEIQIRKLSKVLLGRGFGSLPSSTETNPRHQVKSISTTIKADSHPIRRIGSP